jgi:hypothetical protein
MNVTVWRPADMVEIELKAGDKVNVGYKKLNYVSKTLTVRRLIETQWRVYVVLSDGCWRPLTTYNKTWWKA